jgi:hypothetical protein
MQGVFSALTNPVVNANLVGSRDPPAKVCARLRIGFRVKGRDPGEDGEVIPFATWRRWPVRYNSHLDVCRGVVVCKSIGNGWRSGP